MDLESHFMSLTLLPAFKPLPHNTATWQITVGSFEEGEFNFDVRGDIDESETKVL